MIKNRYGKTSLGSPSGGHDNAASAAALDEHKGDTELEDVVKRLRGRYVNELDVRCVVERRRHRSPVEVVTVRIGREQPTRLVVRRRRVSLDGDWRRELLRAVASNRSLREFAFVDIPLDDEDAARLAGWVGSNRGLEALELGGNKLTSAARQQLIGQLRLSRSVRSLWMQNLKLDDDDAKSLAALVSENRKLERLYLESNNIGNAGAVALAQAIARIDRLKDLDLDTNVIGDEGMRAMADMVRSVQKLEKLNLRFNADDTREGVQELAEAIWDNEDTRLKEVFVYPHDIGAMLRGKLPAIISSEPNIWGSTIVLDYIRALHDPNVQKVAGLRSKVMIVGQNGVGKTSLLRSFIESMKSEYDPTLPERLCNQDIPPLSDSPTECVDVREVVVPVHGVTDEHNDVAAEAMGAANANVALEGERLTLSFWDFAGEELFHAAHSLFLSAGCVYIVVFDPTSDNWDESRYRAWLHEIRSRIISTEDSDDVTTPVFLVATHFDKYPSAASSSASSSSSSSSSSSDVKHSRTGGDVFARFNELAVEFPDLLKRCRYFHISTDRAFNTQRRYQAITTLRKQLVLTAMLIPHVHKPVDKKWKDALAQIHTRRKSMKLERASQGGGGGGAGVPLQSNEVELHRILRKCYIQDEHFGPATQMLRQWGALLRYESDGRTTVCFDPNWLSAAIRRVINARTQRDIVITNGLVDRSALNHVWRDFDQATRENLLTVLRMNKLSFPVGEQELLPCMITRLPDKDERKVIDGIRKDNDYLANQWVLSEEIRGLPRELLGMAMAAVVGIDGCEILNWWTTGAHVRLQGVDAMLRLEDSALCVFVHGTRNEDSMRMLSNAVEWQVFGSYKHLSQFVKDRRASCAQCAEETAGIRGFTPRWFSFADLETMIQEHTPASHRGKVAASRPRRFGRFKASSSTSIDSSSSSGFSSCNSSSTSLAMSAMARAGSPCMSQFSLGSSTSSLGEESGFEDAPSNIALRSSTRTPDFALTKHMIYDNYIPEGGEHRDSDADDDDDDADNDYSGEAEERKSDMTDFVRVLPSRIRCHGHSVEILNVVNRFAGSDQAFHILRRCKLHDASSIV
eukprot:TRINITY_DN67704_c7_g8_i1.p1 TRINITY_DN67704_c7_g8~~TRINITY_DN67704_c7_g8_i1.p1  ORF type:complete len:1085 (-),score=437.20 TRINITY_DN67704_c7_g8_i1:1398-4652(-)